MKKMMIIAVMMGAMLMPAQMMAKENRNARPRVENRVKKNEKRAPKMKFDNARPGKPDRKFDNRNKGRKPMPPVAMRPRRPMPRPMPRPRPVPRPIYHNHCCDNDFVVTMFAFVMSSARRDGWSHPLPHGAPRPMI